VETAFLIDDGQEVLPSILKDYTTLGQIFVTTVTNRRDYQSRTVTNLLGQTIRSEVESETCLGGWCTTSMEYDAWDGCSR